MTTLTVLLASVFKNLRKEKVRRMSETSGKVEKYRKVQDTLNASIAQHLGSCFLEISFLNLCIPL